MGDVKLTPLETSRLLTHLDESVKKVSDARDEIIQAMARRSGPGDAAAEPASRRRGGASRKKR
jgi:hypothetical protein